MSHILRIVVILLLPCCLPGQSFNAFNKAGDKAYAKRDYHAALHYYGQALEFKQATSSLKFKYAEAARQFNAYEVAAAYYQQVLESEANQHFPTVPFYLGTVYKKMGRYEEAMEQFEAYLNRNKTIAELADQAKLEIEHCQWAMEQTQQPERYRVNQLNRRINTGYSEFGAYASGDTIYYSSYRFENEGDKHQPPKKIAKVLYSLRQSRGRTMRRSFNEDTLHTAHTAFSLDRNRIYFTQCADRPDGSIRCAIYYREKDRRRRWKSRAVKLPESINLDSFTSTQPAIGYDSLLQSEVLFFASDRPGGVGALDIWMSKVGEGEQFSDPVNLTGINTKANDATPFFHDPSQVLYFSSEGHRGLGGYDLFRTRRDSLWQQPVKHLDFPLNTSYNDIYPFVKTDGTSGYISSNREGSFYLDRDNKSCCNDLYYFEWIPPIEEQQEIDSIGIVEMETPPDSDPPKQPERLEDFLPLALYFDNDEPDRRTRRTTTKKSYEDTFLKYYDRRREYRQEYAKPLPEEDQAIAELEISEFFEQKVKRGYDHLFLFSKILLKRLQEGEQVEIFIKGFTSPRAKSDYNLALSQRRISSLRNHFDDYQEGVFKPYIESGQLKVTEQPFGETTADRAVSDALEDQRNSIYSVGAAQERRVEIVEIKRGGD